MSLSAGSGVVCNVAADAPCEAQTTQQHQCLSRAGVERRQPGYFEGGAGGGGVGVGTGGFRWEVGGKVGVEVGGKPGVDAQTSVHGCSRGTATSQFRHK